jgi:hypothetical protein
MHLKAIPAPVPGRQAHDFQRGSTIRTRIPELVRVGLRDCPKLLEARRKGFPASDRISPGSRPWVLSGRGLWSRKDRFTLQPSGTMEPTVLQTTSLEVASTEHRADSGESRVIQIYATSQKRYSDRRRVWSRNPRRPARLVQWKAPTPGGACIPGCCLIRDRHSFIPYHAKGTPGASHMAPGTRLTLGDAADLGAASFPVATSCTRRKLSGA